MDYLKIWKVKIMKNNVGLVAQTVLSVALVTFAIFYFLEPKVLIVLQTLTALFMFVLAYNNKVTFKRNKWCTIAYLVAGFLIIGAIIF